MTVNIRENEERGDVAPRLSGPIAHETQGATEIAHVDVDRGNKKKGGQNQNPNQKAISSDRKESSGERERRRDARGREGGCYYENYQSSHTALREWTVRRVMYHILAHKQRQLSTTDYQTKKKTYPPKGRRT